MRARGVTFELNARICGASRHHCQRMELEKTDATKEASLSSWRFPQRRSSGQPAPRQPLLKELAVERDKRAFSSKTRSRCRVTRGRALGDCAIVMQRRASRARRLRNLRSANRTLAHACVLTSLARALQPFHF